MIRTRLSVVVALALVAACARNPRDRVFEVSGTVTVGGQPVPEGGITLKSGDRTLPDDYGAIENGRFRFLASGGTKRVEIRAIREVPPPNDGKLHDPKFEEYIPPEFNERSKLTVEVVPGGQNEFTFDLKPGQK